MLTISTEFSPYSKFISIYRKLLSADENYGTTLKNMQELITFNEMIMSSPSVAEVFYYFCLRGASTSLILQNELNMPGATAHRAIKRLKNVKLVVPALKVSKTKDSKGGPRPTVWALEGSTTEEVAVALRLHYKMLSPKYIIAEKVAQTILEEYVNKRQVDEISYSEILVQVKAMNIPFRTPDIAELAATYISDKGIKVWR